MGFVMWVPAESWKLRRPVREIPMPQAVDVLYVHHDAGPLMADALRTVRQHQADHLARGWNDIAYQAWVAYTGTAYEGRGFDVQDGATGCQGGKSRSICLQGNFEHVIPTRAQIETLTSLIVQLAREGKLRPGFRIEPHNRAPACPTSWTTNTNATLCCGKNLIFELPGVRAEVARRLEGPRPPKEEGFTMAEIDRLVAAEEETHRLLRFDFFTCGASQWVRTPLGQNIFPVDGKVIRELGEAGRLNDPVELTDEQRDLNWRTFGGP